MLRARWPLVTVGPFCAVVLVSGLLFGSIACDGDNTPPSFFDASGDTTSDVQTDVADATLDAPMATHAKIIAVHASPDLGAIRFCFATGTQNDGSDGAIDPIAPLPKTAIAAGGGGALPDLGADLSKQALTPYAFLSQKIGTSTQTCDALATSLTKGTDYFVLPTIKNGTLVANSTWMVAVTGCLPTALDAAADVTTCGATYDAAKGNLALSIFALDRVIGNTQRFGAQFAHVASPANGVWSAEGAQSVSALLHPFDGGADLIIADNVKLGQLAPSNAASLPMPTIDKTALQINAIASDGGASPASAAIPLPLVYEATTGQSTGENAYFAPGVNYTFVLLGDPRAPITLDGGVFNGYSLHALSFPNDPTLPSQ